MWNLKTSSGVRRCVGSGSTVDSNPSERAAAGIIMLWYRTQNTVGNQSRCALPERFLATVSPLTSAKGQLQFSLRRIPPSPRTESCLSPYVPPTAGHAFRRLYRTTGGAGDEVRTPSRRCSGDTPWRAISWAPSCWNFLLISVSSMARCLALLAVNGQNWPG